MSRVRLLAASDFTGGLNLREDSFLLANNEVPEVLNMDFGVRGGFVMRKGMSPTLSDITLSPIAGIHEYTLTNEVIVQGDGGWLERLSGGVWVTLGAGPLAHAHSAMYDSDLYFCTGTEATRKYDGAALTALTEDVYNENLAAPVGGRFPRAKFAAEFGGSMFCASTLESGTAHPTRVRWSHFDSAGDWRADDYIDVGGAGDAITALVPFADRLLVFKEDSIHAIYGFAQESFSLYPVSMDHGCPWSDGVVSTPMGVYFWDRDGGVMLLKSSSIDSVFGPLWPALQRGDISALGEVFLAWGDGRLWVSCVHSNVRTLFVCDPAVNKRAVTWTRYLPAPTVMRSTRNGLVGGFGDQLVDLVSNVAWDDLGAGAQRIDSLLLTGWFDLGSPATSKRWLCADLVTAARANGTWRVEAFKDYDLSASLGVSQIVDVRPDSGSFAWGDAWGSGTWGGASSRRNATRRTRTLGQSRAVALRFNGPLTQSAWGLNQLSLRYVPRRVR